jgi:hypothetical protein
MKPEDLKIQDLLSPNIKNPGVGNRSSFIRGWNEAISGEGLGTVEIGKDVWRTIGWHAGNTFGKRDDDFRYALFMWSLNQRRLALGLPEINHLS